MTAVVVTVLTLIVAMVGLLVRISMQMQRTLDRIEKLEEWTNQSRKNWDRFFPRGERIARKAERAEDRNRELNGDDD